MCKRRNMSILFLGGMGLIGSACSALAVQRGFDVSFCLWDKIIVAYEKALPA